MNRRTGRRDASSSSCSRIVPLAWISSPPQSIWKRRSTCAQEAQRKPFFSYNWAVKPPAMLPNLWLDREAAPPWLTAHSPPSPTPCPPLSAPHPFSDQPHALVSLWEPSSFHLPPCMSHCSPAHSSSLAQPLWVGESLVPPQSCEMLWRGSEPPMMGGSTNAIRALPMHFPGTPKNQRGWEQAEHVSFYMQCSGSMGTNSDSAHGPPVPRRPLTWRWRPLGYDGVCWHQ